MKLGVSTGPNLEQIEEMPESFDFVEISVGEQEIPPEEIDTEWLDRVLERKEFGLVVHLPFRQPLATSVEELDSANLDYLERLIEFSAELGAMKAVLHVSIRYGEDPELVEHAVEANVNQLQEIGEKHGVEIVFEHLPQESASAFELREFGERMEELGAPVCFDTGHAYVEAGQEGMEQFLEQNLDGISHLHLQDSMGGDDHVAIGHGEIDWDSAGDRLSDFEGTATFEIFTGEPRYFELSREIFLEALDS